MSSTLLPYLSLGSYVRSEPRYDVLFFYNCIHPVIYIRHALRTRRLGKFTKKENDKEEEWAEPHEDDVPDEVWVQIRDGGFGKEWRIWRKKCENEGPEVDLEQEGQIS